MSEQSLSSNAPRRIGSWSLEARLGMGGMGIVYRARGRRGQLVAVKLLHPWLLADKEALARFQREAEVLEKVDGPCVARVIEADTDGDQPYLVCEYVEGPTLHAQVEREGPLEPDLLLPFAAGLADALQSIHGAGVIHRDLTATNVLLSPSGPRVVDFGIARHAESATVTSTNVVIGTPRWMAPEQILGVELTPATDIFAWGALVAFAASGRSPFGTGDPQALLYRIMNADPDLDSLPPALEPLVMAALAKEPGRRPSGRKLVEQLLVVLEDPNVTISLDRTWHFVPAELPTTRLVAQTGKAQSGKGRRNLAGAAAFLAVAGLSAGGFLFQRSLVQEAGQQEPTLADAPSVINSPPPAASDTGPAATEGPLRPSPEPSTEAAAEAPAEPMSDPLPEETPLPTPPGRPELSVAPWDTAPVPPTDEHLIAAAEMWRNAGFEDRDLYAPTEVSSSLGYQSYFEPQFTRVGDFQMGWDSPDGGFVGLSIWPADNQNVNHFFDADPDPGPAFSDGSEVREDGEGYAFLIAIPGQSCFYEVSYGNLVDRSWALESMRRIDLG